MQEEFYRLESGAAPLLLARAEQLFDRGRSVIIDARPAEEYREGQIEGALNVPIEHWEDLYPELAPWIERLPIVLYAGRDWIGPADDLAAGLMSRGHADSVFVMLDGYEGWFDAGLPTDSGPDRFLIDESEEW